MDGFEWNKVFGAVLGVIFVFMGLSILGEVIYHADENDPSTVLDLPEAAVTAGGDAGPAGAEPILALLAAADVAAGENTAKKCVACHVFEKGGANKVGPHIYGVVGRPIAAVGDFGYSAAMKAYAEGGKAWTFQELNGFLWKPKAHVKGTSMGFAGIRSPEERANLIAWMNTQSDSPLPAPSAEEIAAEAGPAEGEAQPAAAQAGEGATTPAANKTGDPNAEGAIVVDPDTPGAVVAPEGANALGDDPKTEPAGDANVADQPVPSVAAPDTLAPKSTSEGATLPLAPEAGNPRAGAQSDSLGQQGLTPAQTEQLNDGAAGQTQAPAQASTPAPEQTPAKTQAPAQTDAPAAAPAEPVNEAPAPATPAPAEAPATGTRTETTGDTGTQTITVPITPAPSGN